MSTAKFIAERPKRILEVLRLPEVLKEIDQGRVYTLSAFKGLPVIIHPSGAHLRLGIGKRLLTKASIALRLSDFDGNVDERRSYGIQNACNHFWGNHITEAEQVTLKSLVPPYDEGVIAKELAEPVIEGARTAHLSGRYWRADLLGLMFSMEAIGKWITYYRGSYEECLLRELSYSSPVISVVQPSLIYDKKSQTVREFYLTQVSSERMAKDYFSVEGVPYPSAVRKEECITQLVKQSSYKMTTQDEVVDKKVRRKRTIPSQTATEVVSASIPVTSNARQIMNQLNLQPLVTLTHKDHGEFPLALLCGTVVMLDSSGLYVRLYINPRIYEPYLEILRENGLEEDPEYLKFVCSTNSTKQIRDWWKDLGEPNQQAITEISASFTVDAGNPFAERHGGKGGEWMRGTWWRADLLPYILGRSGVVHIPRYLNSTERIFLEGEMASSPFSRVLGEHAYQVAPTALTGYARGRDGEKTVEENLTKVFGDLGELISSSREFYYADFSQKVLGIGVILHEVKNRGAIVARSEIAKLLRDIREVESRGIICMAATMISLRCNVAGHNNKPISLAMAPNGHTLVVFINKAEGVEEEMLTNAKVIIMKHVQENIDDGTWIRQ